MTKEDVILLDIPPQMDKITLNMKKREIVKILKEVANEAEQKYKARIKGVFGSFTRGEEHSNSDIDILVEFTSGANLFDLVELSYFLEDILHKEVDIVPINTLREEIKEDVLKEALYI